MVPLLRSRDAAAVTAELCSTLQRQGRVSDLLPFYHAVISHEALSSTFNSPGWALPHARIAGIPQLSFRARADRRAAGLVWRANWSSWSFLLAVPESEAAVYLGLISGLAKAAPGPRAPGTPGDAPDSEAMFEVLQEIPLPKRRPAAVVA